MHQTRTCRLGRRCDVQGRVAIGVANNLSHLKSQGFDKSVDLAQTRFEFNLTKSKLAGDCVDKI
jgi:hypothetical protein